MHPLPRDAPHPFDTRPVGHAAHPTVETETVYRHAVADVCLSVSHERAAHPNVRHVPRTGSARVPVRGRAREQEWPGQLRRQPAHATRAR